MTTECPRCGAELLQWLFLKDVDKPYRAGCSNRLCLCIAEGEGANYQEAVDDFLKKVSDKVEP